MWWTVVGKPLPPTRRLKKLWIRIALQNSFGNRHYFPLDRRGFLLGDLQVVRRFADSSTRSPTSRILRQAHRRVGSDRTPAVHDPSHATQRDPNVARQFRDGKAQLDELVAQQLARMSRR